MAIDVLAPVARINGVPLHAPGEMLDDETLRQRACTELLRQAAVAAGIDDASAADAIEKLLDRELHVPEPSDDACRRHFDADPARWGRGERLHLRHLLLAVMPGVDVVALRRHAEALLLDVRCAEAGGDTFAAAAGEHSNCPSGAQGGDLGWLSREHVAPEFARQVFAQQTVGVLPRLVHSRHGLHVIEVLERESGAAADFASVRSAVALSLHQEAWINALREFLQRLAGQATLEGVRLDAADTPLVQ